MAVFSRIFFGLWLVLSVFSVSALSGPVEISGRYPHLTVYNDDREVGIGALVYWQDRLWAVTYSAHKPEGSSDKLYSIDRELNLWSFPESVGGTPANRLIHRETNQLLIGPYLIDENGNIRVIPPGKVPQDAKENRMFGRLTATARHLHEPEKKVYYFDMEGVLYEVDVRTLEVRLLYVRPVPGRHAKGGYSGQGRLVLANNGEIGGAKESRYGKFEYQIDPERRDFEERGVLADWDGKEDWRLIRRRQFTEVTGPGGIYGAPDEEAPVWATGWDKRSLFLMVMQEGEWHEFRLPKADYSYDGTHGWHTEWPRIRRVVPEGEGEPGRFLMFHHGGFYDFPAGLRVGDLGGLRPIGNYLKIVSDVESWPDGRLVFAANDVSVFENPSVNRSQSNFWFTDREGIYRLGRPAGWGGVWMEDSVGPGEFSVPFLIGGYEKRILHLAHREEEPVSFFLEIDREGKGDWRPYRIVEVPANGYRFHLFGEDFEGEWIRLSVNRPVGEATAYFHFGPSGGAVEESELFEPLADVGEEGAFIRGILRPRGGENIGKLHLLAAKAGEGEIGGYRYYELDQDLNLRARPDDAEGAERLRAVAEITESGTEVAPNGDLRVGFDSASVIVWEGDRVFRLPKGDAAYDEDWPGGPRRAVRDLVTERSILNAHGIFYMLPRNNSGGVRALKPISTHNKRIVDWASWSGLVAILGTKADADGSHSNFVASEDGGAGVWLGDIDDLWKMGKVRGRGGPWFETEVEAGVPSDPYLMTGFDRKRVELWHDSGEEVRIALEVDLFGAADTPESWFRYGELSVGAGERVVHHFPDGYAAQWIRLVSDRDVKATAVFVYE